MKNLIRKEFENITMPSDCAKEIRQSMETVHPGEGKNYRRVLRPIIAVAAILCLLLSATAVGVQKGWLDGFLGNSEKAEGVEELQLTAKEGNMEVTVDRMMADGPFVFVRFSVRTKGEVNAAEQFEVNGFPSEALEGRIHMIFAEGPIDLPLSERGQAMVGKECLRSEGVSRTYDLIRLDDGSDINFCSYTMGIILLELPSDYEGLELSLSLEKLRNWTSAENGGYITEERETYLIEESIVLSDSKAKLMSMEDGRQVKVHTLGVQIQGFDFPLCDEEGNWISGVVLKDGTKLPFKPGYQTQDYYTEEMQWSKCPLKEIVDPREVSAVYVGDVLYPLH